MLTCELSRNHENFNIKSKRYLKEDELRLDEKLAQHSCGRLILVLAVTSKSYALIYFCLNESTLQNADGTQLIPLLHNRKIYLNKYVFDFSLLLFLHIHRIQFNCSGFWLLLEINYIKLSNMKIKSKPKS